MTEITPRKATPEELAEQKAYAQGEYDREVEAVKMARHALYTAQGGSDAIYLKWQRGEATEQEWLDAIKAIDDANPYPAAPVK